MLSDISNAESESDVDDVGLTAVEKSTDDSLLTPVHEEVCVVLIYRIQSLFTLTRISFVLCPVSVISCINGTFCELILYLMVFLG